MATIGKRILDPLAWDAMALLVFVVGVRSVTVWCQDREFGETGEVLVRPPSLSAWRIRNWTGESDRTLGDLSAAEAAEERRWEEVCLEPDGAHRQGHTIVWFL